MGQDNMTQVWLVKQVLWCQLEFLLTPFILEQMFKIPGEVWSDFVYDFVL